MRGIVGGAEKSDPGKTREKFPAYLQPFVPTEHRMLSYLLPTILVAIYFGSTLAVLTSFASGLAAAYFLLPPKFSFYIDDPLHFAELGFTIASSRHVA